MLCYGWPYNSRLSYNTFLNENMGRWTQYDEDPYRLPEGVQRVAYDADTARYTFRDDQGNMYLGPAHEQYGTLTLVGKSRPPSDTTSADRPQAFASGKSRPDLSVAVSGPPGDGSTFHDLVPAHLIASASSADSRLSASPDTGEPLPGPSGRLRDAMRRAALPSMANVANNLRRSHTRKQRNEEKDGLLRSDSRSSTTPSTTTLVSVDEKKI
ncbi:hypothetical protein GGX14DRAFT_496109 [Mycena pura]|uniref:Uncharacterized protein n=1 Tax=Mycena pura TaxID=153505 RepID=A0AAD6VLC1_9AGAR|nr:hypothetical protein GGX14DRAFT_496109 [Mycena pura]